MLRQRSGTSSLDGGGNAVGRHLSTVEATEKCPERQMGHKTRIAACGVSLSNAEDLGKWLGASEHTIFNFSPG